MATMYRYQLPVDQTGWTLSGQTQTAFTWEYEDERSRLLALYDKGKKQQWDAATRIDWSQDLDPENPQEIDDRLIPIFGSALWDKLTDKEKVHLRHHQQAQTLSQFMHGEQGALMAAARIVQTVPDLDAKFYAATQVMDEARHVEAYARLLNEKLGIAYPITPGLKSLLETVLTDRRWDMTYLGMQILIEGLALAAFQRIRDFAKNRLAASVNAYVMQDEARHVAFGRLALRDFYPPLSDPERGEREEHRRGGGVRRGGSGRKAAGEGRGGPPGPPRLPLSDRRWRHRRAREAAHLQRLHDERELVDLLGCQLVQLQIFEQMDAVHHEHDLVDGQRDLLVGVRRHLDWPVVGADQHRVLLGQPLGSGNPDAGARLRVAGVVFRPQLAPARVDDDGVALLERHALFLERLL